MAEQMNEKPLTSPAANIVVNCDGFAGTPELLSSLQLLVSSIELNFGLDLRSLEGLTVFQNYQDGLSRFKTGVDGDLPLSATTGGNEGMGMTPIVLRAGELKSHVLLPRKIVDAALVQDVSAVTNKARYAIAHELAHSDDHKHAADRFREEVLEMISNQNRIDIACRATWSEYYVCRKVAQQCPAILNDLEETAVRALESFGADADIAAQTAKAGDFSRGQALVIGAGLNLFITIARLLGHLDGIERNFDQHCKVAGEYLPACVKSSDLEDLRRTLSSLWTRRNEWKSFSETKAVRDHLSRILNRIG